MDDLQTNTRPVHGDFLALDVFRAAGRVDGQINGYAVTFGGKPNRKNAVILPGAVTQSLADHKARGSMPAMLHMHDMTKVVGRWTDVTEDSFGVRVTGVIDRESDLGAEVWRNIKNRAVTALSIGFRPTNYVGDRFGKNGIQISEMDLMEVSIVPIGADPRAQLFSADSVGSQRQFDRLLKEVGFPKQMAAQLAAGGWPAAVRSREKKSIPDRAVRAFADRVRAATAALKEQK